MNYLKYVIDNIKSEDYTPEEYYWRVVAILKEFGSYHSMVTAMTVKGTSTGRVTGRASEPASFPSGIRGTRPDLVVVDDVTPENPCLDIEYRKSPSEPGMVFVEDEVEAVKHLTSSELLMTDHTLVHNDFLDLIQEALNVIPNTQLHDNVDTYSLAASLERLRRNQ